MRSDASLDILKTSIDLNYYGYFRRALLWNWLWIICQLNSFPINPQSLIKRSWSKFVHMLARIEIPFPVFLPNPGLMSAKQINNSPSVGNAEKSVKNNPNNLLFLKINYVQNCIFPKENYDKPFIALEQFGKKTILLNLRVSPFCPLWQMRVNSWKAISHC